MKLHPDRYIEDRFVSCISNLFIYLFFQNPYLKQYDGRRNEMFKVSVFFLQLYLLGKSSDFGDLALVTAHTQFVFFNHSYTYESLIVITVCNITFITLFPHLFLFAIAVKLMTQSVPLKCDTIHMVFRMPNRAFRDIFNPDG